MKKKSVAMKGANLVIMADIGDGDVVPRKSTSPSIAAANPLGALVPASWRAETPARDPHGEEHRDRGDHHEDEGACWA